MKNKIIALVLIGILSLSGCTGANHTKKVDTVSPDEQTGDIDQVEDIKQETLNDIYPNLNRDIRDVITGIETNGWYEFEDLTGINMKQQVIDTLNWTPTTFDDNGSFDNNDLNRLAGYVLDKSYPLIRVKSFQCTDNSDFNRTYKFTYQPLATIGGYSGMSEVICVSLMYENDHPGQFFDFLDAIIDDESNGTMDRETHEIEFNVALSDNGTLEFKNLDQFFDLAFDKDEMDHEFFDRQRRDIEFWELAYEACLHQYTTGECIDDFTGHKTHHDPTRGL